MPEYSDPANRYSLTFPEGWLPLTHESSPHISLASLTTGGYLKVESYEFEQAAASEMHPEKTLRALLECERLSAPGIGQPVIRHGLRQGAAMAYTSFSRPETSPAESASDFGHARAWVFTSGRVQVRCLYRCRTTDEGIDDEDLDTIIASLSIEDTPGLDAESFCRYYYTVLKRHRPQLIQKPPEGLTLTLADGQTVLLEHIYNHYLLEPDRMEELIDTHINLLDYCGDDVPDLTNYEAIRPLLFPKVFRAMSDRIPPHRLPSWPGLQVGAVVRGRVFTYGVNVERLTNWGFQSLADILDDLMRNLHAIPPVAPRGLRSQDGATMAISYVDHPFCASFILFEDFFETTAHNLGVEEFLVGLPDPSCASCFTDNDPRFVVQHTALLRWDYHRSVERLTDLIYLVTGPRPEDAKPYDVLHCCPKKAA